MTVGDIAGFLEDWAPPDTAWEKDNCGLQAGDPSARLRGILLALDPTASAVEEAARTGANLLITHHPLFFHPLRSATPDVPAAGVLRRLLAGGIHLYSAHTNLDAARGGTSFALGERLGLRHLRFLTTPFRRSAKVVTFAPAAAIEAIARAMGAAGAGRIGEYGDCSFRTNGTGTFRGSSRSTPVIGRRGRLEAVEEVRLEMLVRRALLPAVLKAMRGAHPYEEPAYDVIPLGNPDNGHGMGAIGECARPLALRAFVAMVKGTLHCGAVRWCGPAGRTVRIAAVCGGSGSEFLPDAVREGADAFVTADIRYHTFQETAGGIGLVDAGHYETEAPVLDAMARRLRSMLRARGERVTVRTARRSANPVAGM